MLEDDSSHASKHPNDTVRRRRWVRYRQLESESLGIDEEPPSLDDYDHHHDVTEEKTEAEDPFSITQKSNTTGFRVPTMKFPLRGEKDHTKDYQNLGTSDINWIVKPDSGDSATKSVEAIEAETADLEVFYFKNKRDLSSH